ncbi:MAG: DNA/RNA non-specific endonuclease [Spirochaetaceae bacterium]|nr:DNA/RNA non-specific endonuclease [Spirochaetaceae bacterium]MBR6565276.1 DNA/RNA non-specific endonuclease [Spirochaetaceae bacterium]
MGTTSKKSGGKKSVKKAASTVKKHRKSKGFVAFVCILVIALALLYLFGPRDVIITLVYDYTGIILPEALPWEYKDAPVDAELVLSQSSEAGAELSGDLPAALEIPLCSHTDDSHEVHQYAGFALCYREQYEQAEWVAYEINTAELVKEAGRTDDFRPDPNISTGSASLADYKGSGYDRGHLAPAADMAFSHQTMSESFYMSNMSPQAGGFNRGVWKDLEANVREWAEEFGSVYVISGPVLEKDEYPTIGENAVAIPEYYYKVLFAPEGRDGKAEMIGFLLPNEKTKEDYFAFVVPVDEIEQRTGLDFFHSLPDNAETSLESQSHPEAWQELQ